MNITEEIKISDNGFVFNSKTGDSFNVNPTGLELIKLIAQNIDFDSIKEIFIQKYDIDDLAFEKDYHEFCAMVNYHQVATTEDPLDFK
ncbi:MULTISPECIES: PqqD family protein [unclassified Lentimicrobium]|uniref:PqqD family protein n=1 Tax=unclassified Lentimicrobium TaxID=2677434 RepID=UPI001551B8AB|nr:MULTISPECIES: PqqD family protein [unclassified Lentimicrobium]NPD47106.1 PqqD family protein [Lentimicrobium sp. S6]NPD85754.1 PqqD family protein [Lentimicrobium sp. L6]